MTPMTLLLLVIGGLLGLAWGLRRLVESSAIRTPLREEYRS